MDRPENSEWSGRRPPEAHGMAAGVARGLRAAALGAAGALGLAIGGDG